MLKCYVMSYIAALAAGARERNLSWRGRQTRRQDRDAKGVEVFGVEGDGYGERYPFPIRLGGLREHHELPQRGLGKESLPNQYSAL